MMNLSLLEIFRDFVLAEGSETHDNHGIHMLPLDDCLDWDSLLHAGVDARNMPKKPHRDILSQQKKVA